MPNFPINGIDLYYERHGSNGPPLVLVHGLTGDITDWRHQIAELSATYRILVLDNRGHGRSATPSDAGAFSIELMADDVEALAAHVGFERYHLVGHSMGGTIAQEIALRSPQKLLSLTLHDTSYSFRKHRLQMPDRPPILSPERMEQVMARIAGMAPDTIVACWKALTGWPGTEERAPRIRIPTLVIFGEHDAVAIVEGSRRLVELIPGSELCAISDAAHSPQEEQPAAYNHALRRFLSAAVPKPLNENR